MCLLTSHTRLAPCALPTDAFAHLTHLELNACKAQWGDVIGLGRAMPRLGTLLLEQNAVALSTTPRDAFPQLTTLSLRGNALDDFDAVAEALLPLPRLARLLLGDNRLACIPESSRAWPALDFVQLEGNPLQSWQSLEALEQQLPRRTWSLQLGAAASFAQDEQSLRREAIARLGRLASLDYTPVTEHERNDAERYFLSHPPNHAQDTKRYEALVALHGAPVPAKEPPTLNTKQIHIGVALAQTTPLPAEADAWLQTALPTVSLLRTLPLRQARRRILGTYKVASATFYGLLRGDAEALIIPFDDETQTLDTYGMQNGDVVAIVPTLSQ